VSFASAAILAGGAGRRLGGIAKEALKGPDGRALGPDLARRLESRFDEVLVVTKDPELYAGTGARALYDLVPGFGPLSGLHAALEASSSEWLWLAACDMPAFSPDFVDFLAAWIDSAQNRGGTPGMAAPYACLARFGSHFEPFQAFYSTRLLPRLEALFKAAETLSPGESDGRRPSFRSLFEDLPVIYVPESDVRVLSPDWSLFFNINRPEDLARYRASIG
jgi:molybdopterin-guanine dinucleotide biosynthesis protein A